MTLIIRLFIFTLLVTSKNNGTVATALDSHSAENQSNPIQPETMINGLALFNSATVVAQLGDVMEELDTSEALPFVTFANADHNEYLKMVFLPGSSRNEFGIFEVGLLLSEKVLPSRTMRKDNFVSERGIQLGITKRDVLRLKGISFKSNADTIKYVINDFEHSVFLKRYNMPIYFAEYKFDSNERLIWYRVGFEYP